MSDDLMLSILIPTLKSREQFFLRLAEHLAEQAKGKPVEIIGLQNNGAKGLGWYRDQLVHAARGEYVAFIDDDDCVADYYTDTILAAITEKPDVIMFPQFCTGTACPVTMFNLEYAGVSWEPVLLNGLPAYIRPFSHVMPLRAEIARQVSFQSARQQHLWTQEDQAFAARVVPILKERGSRQKILQTPLYCYCYNAAGSSTQAGQPKEASEPMPLVRPVVDCPEFRWIHPEIEP